MPRGLFIVFEGIDGAGTTTQSKRLARRIEEKGFLVVETREPGGTPLAERIRDLVLDPEAERVNPVTELFLYSAGRAQHVSELIEPELSNGKVVVCDRFVDSSLAYQGYARGIDLDTVKAISSVAVGRTTQDITVVLEIPLEEAARRRRKRKGKPDRLEGEGEALQKRVKDGYTALSQQDRKDILVLDGTLNEEKIAQRVWQELMNRFPRFPFT